MNDKILRDNLRFGDDNSCIIFNHYSFCELIKHIMVKYGNIRYQDANEKLRKHYLIEEPKSFMRVVLMTHELEYHWAMLVVYGEGYWLKGIPSDYNDFENEYLTWESETLSKYNLKEPYEYFEKTN